MEYNLSMTNTTSTFQIHIDGVTVEQYNSSRVTISAKFNSEEERQTFLALFPKYVGFRPVRIYRDGEVNEGVSLAIKLAAGIVTGEVNESGIKRLTKIAQVAKANDIEIVSANWNWAPGHQGWTAETLLAFAD